MFSCKPNLIFFWSLSLLFLFGFSSFRCSSLHAEDSVKFQNNATNAISTTDAPKKHHHKKSNELVATGEHSKKLLDSKPKNRMSSWDRYKMKLPFWPRKIFTFLELGFMIILGIFIGQILEELGIIKALGFITWPISFLGKLPRSTSPAFLFALQSGAMANSMLVSQRDNGQLTPRELYTSVFVVSSLSLFAHLPTYIIPLGNAFGWKAATFYFGVRFAAIFVQIMFILIISQMFFLKKSPSLDVKILTASDPEFHKASRKHSIKTFFNAVNKKSMRTIKRLLIYLLPTFFLTAFLEKSDFFNWLGTIMETIPLLNALPPQAPAVIAVQAINLYNGAIMAGSFIDSGLISVRDAILILLTGTLVTAPIRTLKHSLGSYVAILGARPGLLMAIATQTTRSIFLLIFIIGCALLWR